MILLVSGSTRTVSCLAGGSARPMLGHLLTPKNRNGSSLLATGLPWGFDNGAYAGLDLPAWRRKLSWVSNHSERCLWAVCPDKVADAQETRRLFDDYEPEIRAAGLPVAYVGQDGAEAGEIPWDRFRSWFIGGSTRWKLSQASADLVQEAKARGKWCHMGRVNSLRRMRAAFDMGCDSVDGSSMSMFGDKYIGRFAAWIRQLNEERTFW